MSSMRLLKNKHIKVMNMKEYNLGFISDRDIFTHVKATVKRYSNKIDLKAFNKNIIDPIKLTFDAKVYGRSLQEVIEAECIRQIDKSNNNHIGYFHQNIFRYVGNGWVVPKKGFDVVNEQQHIYVEMKNKHNTMNSSSSSKTYMRMQNKILRDSEATCLLVEAIAAKSQDKIWVVSIDGETFKHKMIRRVSMDKFYGIVFGDEQAFMKLCRALPSILDDVIEDMKRESLNNTVFHELANISPDIMKSLYLLAFKTYEGFDNF